MVQYLACSLYVQLLAIKDKVTFQTKLAELESLCNESGFLLHDFVSEEEILKRMNNLD